MTQAGSAGARMCRRWGSRAAAAALTLLFSVATPLVALAQDENETPHDARTMGYPQDTPLGLEGGTALTWLLFVFLAIIGLAALFKDAKRTHLD